MSDNYRFRDVRSGQGPVNIGRGNRAAGRDYYDNRSSQHIDNRGGHYAGRDYHDRRSYVRQGDNYDVQVGPADPLDAVTSGRGIGRLLAAIGTLVSLTGFVGIGWLIVGTMTNMGPNSDPENPFAKKLSDHFPVFAGAPVLAVAASAFLAGAILAAIGASMAKAARRRHDRRMRGRPHY
jgi:hypothetical protein